MPDVTGPSLDQLDAWSTSIDALDVSLDDSAWTTRTLFEPTLAGSIALTGTGVATFTTHATAAASVAITGTAAAGYVKDVTGAGSTAITGTAAAERIQTVSGAGAVAVTATGLFGTILIAGSSEVGVLVIEAEGSFGVTVSPSVNATISITAAMLGEKLGDAWSVVTRDDSSADWKNAA